MDEDAGIDEVNSPPSELEMMLRRNLTLCRCQHSFLTHELTMHDLSCSECACEEFREMLIS
jgi:hypothetical protein